MAFQKCCMSITSANANNGSGFEGLGDNNIFWNVTTGYCIAAGKVSSNHWTDSYHWIAGE